MKEIPILFSIPMVQAILAGRKTMTRRTKGLDKINKSNKSFYFQSLVHHATGRFTFVEQGNYNPTENDVIHVKPPYNCGNLLYVRETVRIGAWREDGRIAYDYKASPELVNTPWVKFEDDADGKKFEDIHIRISNELFAKGIHPDTDGYYHWEPGKSPLKWSSSIHMPKSAARIWLKVIELRIERLHQITLQDIESEGIQYKSHEYTSPNHAFESLWSKINGQESWDSNPWVWVISFEVLSTTGKPNAQTINL